MDDQLAMLASELPILDSKAGYRYLTEIVGNGAYRQVAWERVNGQYVPLYGLNGEQLVQIENRIEIETEAGYDDAN